MFAVTYNHYVHKLIHMYYHSMRNQYIANKYIYCIPKCLCLIFKDLLGPTHNLTHILFNYVFPRERIPQQPPL